MNDTEKKRAKSIYELYGIAKFGINPKKFNQLDGDLNNQIKGSMDLIFFNKLIPQNFGDYMISFTIIIIFSFIFSRQYILNFFHVARSDWQNYKCDPRIMPYSGYVKKNEDSTEFISTGDNFNECIEPISKYMAQSNFDPFNDVVNMDLSNLVDTLNQSASELQGSLNQLKDQINNIMSMISLEDNKKNTQTNKATNQNMSMMLTMNALFQSISNVVTGTNLSIQSILTYIYGFFEGALVLLSIFIVTFSSLGGLILSISQGLLITGSVLTPPPFTTAFGIAILANVPILTAIGFTFLMVALAFLAIFIAVVITMLMYAEFLKTVFNIDVQGRKTSTPPSPI